MFDPNKPIRTRDGREARIVCTDAKGKQPIVAMISVDGREIAYQYSSDGISSSPAHADLVNVSLTWEERAKAALKYGLRVSSYEHPYLVYVPSDPAFLGVASSSLENALDEAIFQLDKRNKEKTK